MLAMGKPRCYWLTPGQKEAQLIGRIGSRGQQGGDGQLHSLGQKSLTKRGLGSEFARQAVRESRPQGLEGHEERARAEPA